jgi:hypothetical protein
VSDPGTEEAERVATAMLADICSGRPGFSIGPSPERSDYRVFVAAGLASRRYFVRLARISQNSGSGVPGGRSGLTFASNHLSC